MDPILGSDRMARNRMARARRCAGAGRRDFIGNCCVGCHRWAWKSRGGWVGSAAPLGLGIHNPCPPTADAVGDCLSALRA